MGDITHMDPAAVAAFANSLTPEQIAQAQWDIENAGRITMHQFKIALGVLFGLAALSFFGRITIRLASRRRLFLDDGFLILAFVCLVGGTAIQYKRIPMTYLEFSVLMGDQTIALLAFQQMDNLFEQSKWQVAYLFFLWTAIFSVKWCYLAFFYPLLRTMSRKLIYYYWSAVTFSVVSWLFLVVGEQLLTCPYVGKAASKCFPELPASKQVLLLLFWLCPVLDGLTDASVIAIPIIILRKSSMRLLTKIGIGIFLCLSIFMIACSIIRAAGTYYHGMLDYPWQVFWLHSESCIGMIMGSITVYRSTLVGSNEVSDKIKSYFRRLRKRRSTDSDDAITETDVTTPPKRQRLSLRIPRPTMTGLRTMLGNRTRTLPTTATVSTMNSEYGLMDMDYHTHMRAQAMNHSQGSSHKDAKSG